jgi:hypothetical protein
LGSGNVTTVGDVTAASDVTGRELLAMSRQLAVSRQLLELSPGNVTTIIAGLLTTSQKKLAMSQR